MSLYFPCSRVGLSQAEVPHIEQCDCCSSGLCAPLSLRTQGTDSQIDLASSCALSAQSRSYVPSWTQRSTPLKPHGPSKTIRDWGRVRSPEGMLGSKSTYPVHWPYLLTHQECFGRHLIQTQSNLCPVMRVSWRVDTSGLETAAGPLLPPNPTPAIPLFVEWEGI